MLRGLVQNADRQFQKEIKQAGILGSWPGVQTVCPNGEEETTAHQALQVRSIKENMRLSNWALFHQGAFSVHLTLCDLCNDFTCFPRAYSCLMLFVCRIRAQIRSSFKTS